MPSKPKLSDLLQEIGALKEREEDDYDAIPGWDGVSIEAMTDKAALLVLPGQNVWFPFTHLRQGDADDVYASRWILDQKALT